MSWDEEFWYPHPIKVRDQQGSGGMGSTFGPLRDVNAEVKDEQRLVRTDDGSQAVSSSTVTVPIESDVSAGSKVIVWPGTAHEREAVVIAVAREENAPPLESHLILSLK